jgi:hypothetical protein
VGAGSTRRDDTTPIDIAMSFNLAQSTEPIRPDEQREFLATLTRALREFAVTDGEVQNMNIDSTTNKISFRLSSLDPRINDKAERIRQKVRIIPSQKQKPITNILSRVQIQQDQFVIPFKGRTYRASSVDVTLAPITSTDKAAVSSSMIGLIVAVVVFGLVLIIALVSVAVRKRTFFRE